MAERGLVFKIQYTERAYNPNVWEEKLIEDGTIWFGEPNTFNPSINFGEGPRIFDIHDPIYESAPEMKAHDFSGGGLETRQPVRLPVFLVFLLPLADGVPANDETLKRYLSEARRLARAVMTTNFQGAELA